MEVELVVLEFWMDDTEEPWLEEAEVDVTIEDVAEEDFAIVLLGLVEAELLPEALLAA